VTEDPDATAGRQLRLPRPALPAEDWPALTGGGLSLGSSIDLAETTRLVLAASVPGFAGGASPPVGPPRVRSWRAGSARGSRVPGAGSRKAPSRRAR
jgi:hypothetical protein